MKLVLIVSTTVVMISGVTIVTVALAELKEHFTTIYGPLAQYRDQRPGETIRILDFDCAKGRRVEFWARPQRFQRIRHL